jgi:hypothetical protein
MSPIRYYDTIKTWKDSQKEDIMATHAGHYKNKIRTTGKVDVKGQETLAMKRCAEKIWNAISKYVTFDNDAVFKDPNWPYLWDKKK